jgi:hypothetical protein
MKIIDHSSGIKHSDKKAWNQVVISMEVPKPEIVGVMELTPRMKACGNRIKDDLGFNFCELIEVRAGFYSGIRCFTQEFQFSFEEQ